jgi:hypothetical protein
MFASNRNIVVYLSLSLQIVGHWIDANLAGDATRRGGLEETQPVYFTDHFHVIARALPSFCPTAQASAIASGKKQTSAHARRETERPEGQP